MKGAFDISNWKESERHLLEKDIQGPSVKKARKAGWWARKFSSAPGNTSVPDYIFGKNGRIFFVEFKRPSGKATEKQSDEHDKMRAVSLTVYVCDTLELFDKILTTEEVHAKYMTASEIAKEWLK